MRNPSADGLSYAECTQKKTENAEHFRFLVYLTSIPHCSQRRPVISFPHLGQASEFFRAKHTKRSERKLITIATIMRGNISGKFVTIHTMAVSFLVSE